MEFYSKKNIGILYIIGDARTRLLVGTLVGGLVTIVLLILAIIFMSICIWCRRKSFKSEEKERLTKEGKLDDFPTM